MPRAQLPKPALRGVQKGVECAHVPVHFVPRLLQVLPGRGGQGAGQLHEPRQACQASVFGVQVPVDVVGRLRVQRLVCCSRSAIRKVKLAVYVGLFLIYVSNI